MVQRVATRCIPLGPGRVGLATTVLGSGACRNPFRRWRASTPTDGKRPDRQGVVQRISDCSQRIIEEFRPTTGAWAPATYAPLLVFASPWCQDRERTGQPGRPPESRRRCLGALDSGGSPDEPDWVHNLVAHRRPPSRSARRPFPSRRVSPREARREDLDPAET
jgi:hypothetical protein